MKDKLLNDLRKELSILKDNIELSELFSSQASSDGFEFLVKKCIDVEFRMDKSKNHARPHIHLNIGKDKHVVSICIKTGETIIGSFNRKYTKNVNQFMTKNSTELMKIWNELHDDKEVILLELKC